jgi:hypothetical protein
MAYGLIHLIGHSHAKFASALPPTVAKNGGQVSAQDGLAQFNVKDPMVANITSFEQNRETLQKVAVTCPLRASLAQTPGSKNNTSAPCEVENFDISEEKGEGLVFACRHAEGGVCAGHLAGE